MRHGILPVKELGGERLAHHHHLAALRSVRVLKRSPAKHGNSHGFHVSGGRVNGLYRAPLHLLTIKWTERKIERTLIRKRQRYRRRFHASDPPNAIETFAK